MFQSIARPSQVTSVIDHAAPTAHRARISGLGAAQADIERIRNERKSAEVQLRKARTAHGDRLSELAGIRVAAQATMDIAEADHYAEQVQRLVAHAEAAEKVVQGWNDQVRKLQTQEREAENRLHELQRRVANLKTVELPVRRENVVRAAQAAEKIRVDAQRMLQHADNMEAGAYAALEAALREYEDLTGKSDAR